VFYCNVWQRSFINCYVPPPSGAAVHRHTPRWQQLYLALLMGNGPSAG
jgi:hypothetical protein